MIGYKYDSTPATYGSGLGKPEGWVVQALFTLDGGIELTRHITCTLPEDYRKCKTWLKHLMNILCRYLIEYSESKPNFRYHYDDLVWLENQFKRICRMWIAKQRGA